MTEPCGCEESLEMRRHAAELLDQRNMERASKRRRYVASCAQPEASSTGAPSRAVQAKRSPAMTAVCSAGRRRRTRSCLRGGRRSEQRSVGAGTHCASRWR